MWKIRHHIFPIVLVVVGLSWYAQIQVSAQNSVPDRANGWVVTTAVFSPDGKTLVTGSLDGRVILFDAKTWNVVHTIETGCYLYSLVFSPDGTMLASASGDGVIRVWDSSTYKQIKALGSVGFDIEAIAFSEDSRSLAA